MHRIHSTLPNPAVLFPHIPANARSLGYRRPVYGVGKNDADYMIQPIINGKQIQCPYYTTWKSMLKRCHDPKYHAKKPTYADCSVAKEWLLFSNFRQWMVNQNWQGLHLDKDIRVPGNKVYAPQVCCFVSHKINTLLGDHAASRGNFRQGVCFIKSYNKFRAQCSNSEGKTLNLGHFENEMAAYVAYVVYKVALIKRIADTQLLDVKIGLYTHANLLANSVTGGDS